MAWVAPHKEAPETRILPCLLLAAVAKTENPSSILASHAGEMAEFAVEILADSGPSTGARAISTAQSIVQKMLQVSEASTPDKLALSASIAACLLRTESDDAPLDLKLAFRVVVDRLMHSSDALVGEAAQSSQAMVAVCNQLHQ